MDLHNNILKSAIDTFGKENQCLVAMEELSELTTALSHFLRKRPHNIAEEIADVQIMLDQLKIIFEDQACLVDTIRNEKLIRLAKRIEKHKEGEPGNG
jgi:NTP pyrophosphatase (non-canonical NTP hydrolase)